MRVLLFGGTGFLGRRVVERLRDRGDEVRVGVRPGSRLVAEGVSTFAFDLAGGGETPAMDGSEAAIYLAQSRRDREWPEGGPDMAAVNVAGLIRALELARLAGVRRFIAASSGSVYRPAFVPLREDAEKGGDTFYALSKLLGERAAEPYAELFELLTIRPFALFGPGQRGRLVPNLVQAVADGREVRLAPARPGEERPQGFAVSLCRVEEAADIVVRLVDERLTGALNVAGPEAPSVRQIAELAGELLGRAPRFRVLPKPRSGDLVADVTRLRALLGLTQMPFAEALGRLLERDPELWHGGG